ncbi:MAG TPA: TetR/AcrR family transcriptional regulator [Pseudonocardia sp.]
MTTDGAGTGRERQRRRTRRAIVSAAADLLARGESPSIVDVADAAEVAKRTVYTYFATIEHLLADAALELGTRAAPPQTTGSDEPAQRLEVFVRSITAGSAETEELGRTIIKLTLDASADEPEQGPRRGYRRVEWIEQALAPVRERVSSAAFERLVSAMVTAVGWEPFIVLRDIRGLDATEIASVSTWMAQTLLAATLAEGTE